MAAEAANWWKVSSSIFCGSNESQSYCCFISGSPTQKKSSAAVELQVSKAVSADEGSGDTVQEDSGHYHLDRDSN